MLDLFGVDVRKAINPLRRRDFESIISRLGRQLNVSSREEERALKRAIDSLDVDWGNLTPLQQDRAFTGAAREIRDSTATVLGEVDQTLETSGEQTVGRTKRETAKRHNLSLESGFSVRDEEVMRFNRISQGNFITDSIGNRSNLFDQEARNIVSSGLEKGLGRRELVDDLQSRLSESGLARKRSYFNVVAASFANRSRTWGQLSSFAEAEIARFTFEAMLDETTSDICRLMHGKSFDVQVGVDLYQQVEDAEDPQDLKSLQPWVRSRKADDGSSVLQIGSGDQARTVARVIESAVGRQDQVGRFAQQMSDAELISNGVVVPPLHGGCRSILVPDI